MNIDAALVALAGILNAPIRAPPLRILAWVKYLEREFNPTINPDGSLTVIVRLYGWEYKRRHPRPKQIPCIDCEGIKQALNAALPPNLTVRTVTDAKTQIYIILEETT